MKKLFLILAFIFGIRCGTFAQNVSIQVVNQPASYVFRNLMEQTGKNFVYSSELLKELKVTLNVKNQPLKNVLTEIFKDTDISYKIKGKNVILKKEKKKKVSPKKKVLHPVIKTTDTVATTVLKELVVFPAPEPSTLETVDIGFKKISSRDINKTPALFGESDIIRTLHTLPGVSEGTEGIAGMYVEGGNVDENQYIIDNIPLYGVNHLAGLFSPFNTDLIDHANFYKSSIPAKFNGRLSSFTDIKIIKGNNIGHHGSARLGLTSGAFNISGPIGKNTTYVAGIRRSWYDVLTIPLFAIVSSRQREDKLKFHYYFTDINAKINHRFSSKLSGFISAYYGNDLFKSGSEYYSTSLKDWYEKANLKLNWGNLVIQSGLNYKISPYVSSEFTIAYNNYFSHTTNQNIKKDTFSDQEPMISRSNIKTDNSIKDLIGKADFGWIPKENLKTSFGVSYTLHSFRPNSFSKEYSYKDASVLFRDSTWKYLANELNAYFDFDWRISDKWRLDLGLNGSLFNIDKKTHKEISPRIAFNYRPSQNFAIKASYNRTVQYMHQLSRSYLSLPTDNWIPITGNFKPATSDKISMGVYWQSNNNAFEASIEGYYKVMNHLMDYKDEYYLLPPLEMWSGRLTTGSGRAKGIQFKFEKKAGKFTGMISYTLAWSDRLFKDKNVGKRFPARFDNRHTINISLNWDVNEKVSLNATWVGHSGNRFTLLSQSFQAPELSSPSNWWDDGVPLQAPLNSYSLPFYHRLDLSCSVKNKKGYWTFGLYNAYCHLNTVAIKRDSENYYMVSPGHYKGVPVFKKLSLFPTIPSISYTWLF